MSALGLAVSATILSFGGATSALAHEHRTVGKYNMVVGFLVEPAYVGLSNGLDLRVYTLPPGVDPETAKESDRVGVTGLEKTLKAEVIAGGEAQKMALTLEPRWQDDGAYDGHFFPTATGDFTYHIFGTVEGNAIDEKFTSSPEGFSSVEAVKDLQFPKKVPSNEELAAEIAASGSSSSQSAAATTASSDGDSNTLPITLAIVGIVLGVGGLAVGGFALSRSKA